MDKRRAFTITEILVVISIIALLMAVLMPSLSKTRRQARAVACLASLKQWGHVFTMYAYDNQGYFMNGRVSPSSPHWWPGGGGGGMGSWWFEVLQPYYKDPDLLLCPIATKPYQEGGRAPFAAWLTPFGVSGSYGANGYIINAPGVPVILGRPTHNNWRTIDVKGGDNIPMVLDCVWFDGWPEHYDIPAPTEGWWEDILGADEMRRFCGNRHDGHINCVFLDSSVRKIGLKQLWKLKWSWGYNVNAAPPDWPDWMIKFKDY